MFRALSFVAAVMVAGTSMAEGGSPCPVDSIPIQVVDVLGTHSVTNPKPDSFKGKVAYHIVDRLGREGICLDSVESKERSLLQFMSWPLYWSDGSPPPVTSLDVRPSNGCRILSPWIDIAIERKPVPWVRAIVRWNERQFLADQAVLAGAKNVPSGVAKPLTNQEYSYFLSEYERSEVREEPEVKPIEERVPPDILWLFHLSWPKNPPMLRRTVPVVVHFKDRVSTFMSMATEKGVKGYTKVVFTLIDRCLASDSMNLRYSSILDVADPVLLDQYKIDTQFLY